MKTALHVLAWIFVICLSQQLVVAASEKDHCANPCGKPTAWDEFNVFELKVTVPGETGYQFWRGQFDKESNDIQIDAESTRGQDATKGRILLIGGRVMATQGPIVEPGYEIGALDAPVLYLKLVVRLLGEALPHGPADVTGDRNIDFKNDTTGVQFATPSAEGYIAAPWRVRGTVKTFAPDDIQYDLALTAAGVGPSSDNRRKYAANFAGRLAKVAAAKIDDGMQLEGWKVFGVGVQSRKNANGTVIDYGTAPAKSTYTHVADVRREIAADDYPGEPDSSKNFTGFWKENCENAFGLQIMPYGNDGKYSVTFCGPGGCGTVGEDGKNTFITKDPDYEVVSESELKIRNADDSWDTYYRCTRDTHPILKYKEQ